MDCERGCRVFIGGMLEGQSKESIEKRFSKVGKILDCWVPEKAKPGYSRNFAYITFQSVEEGDKCRRVFNKTKWQGCNLRVEVAKADHLKKLKRRWKLHKAEPAKPVVQNKKRKCLFQNLEVPLKKRKITPVRDVSSDEEMTEINVKKEIKNPKNDLKKLPFARNPFLEKKQPDTFLDKIHPVEVMEIEHPHSTSRSMEKSFLYKNFSYPAKKPVCEQKPTVYTWNFDLKIKQKKEEEEEKHLNKNSDIEVKIVEKEEKDSEIVEQNLNLTESIKNQNKSESETIQSFLESDSDSESSDDDKDEDLEEEDGSNKKDENVNHEKIVDNLCKETEIEKNITQDDEKHDSESSSKEEEKNKNNSEEKERKEKNQEINDEKDISTKESPEDIDNKNEETKVKEDNVKSTALRAAYSEGGFTALKWNSFYDKGWKPKQDKLTPLFNFSEKELKNDPLVEASKPEFANHKKSVAKTPMNKKGKKQKQIENLERKKRFRKAMKDSLSGSSFVRTDTKEKVKEDFEHGKSNLLRGWKKLSKTKSKKRDL